MSKITLEQWRVLQTVVDAGGFTQAAELLHKSQSSISYSVTKLQQQLGFSILEMEGRKAKLTKRGEILLEHSRLLLQQSEQLESLAATLETSWGDELVVCIDASAPYSLMLNALALFKSRSPGTKVSFIEGGLAKDECSQKKSATCLTITSVPSSFPLTSPILKLKMVTVVSCHHTLAHQVKSVELSDLLREQKIGLHCQGKVEGGFSASSISAVIAMVHRGLGYACLPLCEVVTDIDNGKLVGLNVPDNEPDLQPLFAVIQGDDNNVDAAELFIELIKNLELK